MWKRRIEMKNASDSSREGGRPPRASLRPGAAVAVLVVAALACEDADRAAPAPQPAPAVDRLREEPVPGALYHTELTFVGRGPEPSLLHLRFDNRTDSTSIRLRYRGWFGGAEWRMVLDRADSLPVPRAAWRILPTGPVRIVAGEGGEPTSVILALPEDRLRLDSRGTIGAWASPTGRRESVRLAELLDGSGAETGLLLSRQGARRVDEPPPEEVGQYFFVSDTAGNGLLIMRESTSPDAPVTTWTWFEDTESQWEGGLVLALATTGDAPGRWSFELPEADLLGEIRGSGPVLAGPPDGEPGFELFRVEAALVLDGQTWTMKGIGVQERSP
jgi:hypothetical protein